jgi:lysophospholipase L1-like esterase
MQEDTAQHQRSHLSIHDDQHTDVARFPLARGRVMRVRILMGKGGYTGRHLESKRKSVLNRLSRFRGQVHTGSVGLLTAFVLHLCVPALLLLDLITSWLGGHIALQATSLDEGVIAAVAPLWLSLGLYLLLSKNWQTRLRRISGPLLTFYVVVAMLTMVEVIVRIMVIAPPVRGAMQPYTEVVTRMDPEVYPGISGVKTFTINKLGLRGPLPPSLGSAYRILAIGGSTTICANLDDSEEWPHQLMERLNASQRTHPVWVGNAGRAATTTVHHLVLMQWLPPVLHVDMAIFLIGVNDLAATLIFDGGPTKAFLEGNAGYEGDLPPGTHWRSKVYPRYRGLKLFPLVTTAIRNLISWLHPRGLALYNLTEVRKQRAMAPVLPLPDLSTGIREYRNRIMALADRCQDLHLRCLFLTQPYLWRDDLSPRELSLLWTGNIGQFGHPKGYLSAGSLARAMDLYNRTLLDVCGQRGLECYDIAARIPKNTSAFFDDEHFNEGGAQLVAGYLSQYLLSSPPRSAGPDVPVCRSPGLDAARRHAYKRFRLPPSLATQWMDAAFSVHPVTSAMLQR